MFFIVYHVHSTVPVTLEEIKGVGTSSAFLQGRQENLWDLVVGVPTEQEGLGKLRRNDEVVNRGSKLRFTG